MVNKFIFHIIILDSNARKSCEKIILIHILNSIKKGINFEFNPNSSVF